jgi:hypothetical protein
VNRPARLNFQSLAGLFLFNGSFWQSFLWLWQFENAIVGTTKGDRHEIQPLLKTNGTDSLPDGDLDGT